MNDRFTSFFISKVKPTQILLTSVSALEGVADLARRKIHPTSSFIIIEPPTAAVGSIFVSFKQPDDMGSAGVMESMLRRAGLRAYLAITIRSLD